MGQSHTDDNAMFHTDIAGGSGNRLKVWRQKCPLSPDSQSEAQGWSLCISSDVLGVAWTARWVAAVRLRKETPCAHSHCSRASC